MKRVTGIGGVFFKAQDADKLRAWYKEHLGIQVENYGGTVFKWRDVENPEQRGGTVWTIFPAASTYFAPSDKPMMINYRVENLDALLQQLKQEGVTVDEKTEECEYGRFGWILDPEGNRIELWEPAEGF